MPDPTYTRTRYNLPNEATVPGEPFTIMAPRGTEFYGFWLANPNTPICWGLSDPAEAENLVPFYFHVLMGEGTSSTPGRFFGMAQKGQQDTLFYFN